MPANGVCDKPCAGTRSWSAEPTHAFVDLNWMQKQYHLEGNNTHGFSSLITAYVKVSGYISCTFTVREALEAWPCCTHRAEHGGEGAGPGTPLWATGSDEAGTRAISFWPYTQPHEGMWAAGRAPWQRCVYKTLLSAAQVKGPTCFLDHEMRRKEMKVQSCEDERRGAREKCWL